MYLDFTVKGNQIHLTDQDILDKLKNVRPEPLRTLVVKVRDTEYPVKQAFAVVLEDQGVDRADFISHQARSVFQRLGFEVRRIRKE